MHHLILVVVAGGLLSAGIVYEQLSRRRDARRFPPPGELVDVGGRRLHVLCKGSGCPTVVIEQGAGGPALAWIQLQAEIAKFARVCIYDRAGYQWSDTVKGARTLESRVKDLQMLLEKGRIAGPYVLVAHSYGGFLIRLFAREYPDSVTGMVFVDAPHESVYFRREVLAFYSKVRWFLGRMKLFIDIWSAALDEPVRDERRERAAECRYGAA